jgi:hypothetical protein
MRGASNCGRCVDWRNQAISPAEAKQDSHRFVERQYHLRPANRRRATETSRLRQALQGVAWRHAVSMCADRCTQSGRSRRRDEAIELCDIAGFSSYAVRRSKIVRRRGMLLSLKRWVLCDGEDAKKEQTKHGPCDPFHQPSMASTYDQDRRSTAF